MNIPVFIHEFKVFEGTVQFACLFGLSLPNSGSVIMHVSKVFVNDLRVTRRSLVWRAFRRIFGNNRLSGFESLTQLRIG